MVAKLKQLIRQGEKQLTVSRLGLLLLLLALPGLILPYFQGIRLRDLLIEEYTSFALELVSIAFTVLIIDRVYQQQAVRQEKGQLIRQLRSTDLSLALDAAERLRSQGWLADGTLRGIVLHKAVLNGVNWPTADLTEANLHQAQLCQADLEGINLRHAHMEHVNLSHTNLQGADLTNAYLLDANLSYANLEDALVDEGQLAQGSKLVNCTMPDGKRYNGRFNLRGDLLEARTSGFNVTDPVAMARFYDVSLADYQAGQQAVH